MKEYNYTDMIKLDKTGILFSDGQRIDFDECKRQWALEHEISEEETVCVASRYPVAERADIYFLFYSKDKVRLYFRFKGIFKRKKSVDKFHELQILLNRYGYSSYDMS